MSATKIDHVEVLQQVLTQWRERATDNRKKAFRSEHDVTKSDTLDDCADELQDAITALSAKPEGEAVAWRCKDYREWMNGGYAWSFTTNAGDVTPAHEPLYPHPPR